METSCQYSFLTFIKMLGKLGSFTDRFSSRGKNLRIFLANFFLVTSNYDQSENERATLTSILCANEFLKGNPTPHPTNWKHQKMMHASLLLPT